MIFISTYAYYIKDHIFQSLRIFTPFNSLKYFLKYYNITIIVIL